MRQREAEERKHEKEMLESMREEYLVASNPHAVRQQAIEDELRAKE